MFCLHWMYARGTHIHTHTYTHFVCNLQLKCNVKLDPDDILIENEYQRENGKNIEFEMLYYGGFFVFFFVCFALTVHKAHIKSTHNVQHVHLQTMSQNKKNKTKKCIACFKQKKEMWKV